MKLHPPNNISEIEDDSTMYHRVVNALVKIASKSTSGLGDSGRNVESTCFSQKVDLNRHLFLGTLVLKELEH